MHPPILAPSGSRKPFAIYTEGRPYYVHFTDEEMRHREAKITCLKQAIEGPGTQTARFQNSCHQGLCHFTSPTGAQRKGPTRPVSTVSAPTFSPSQAEKKIKRETTTQVWAVWLRVFSCGKGKNDALELRVTSSARSANQTRLVQSQPS